MTPPSAATACTQTTRWTIATRATRPGLRIISRVNQADWLDRMKQAGANIAQSPYPSYGMSLASAAMSSSVLDIHDFPLLGLGTEEIGIPVGSPLIGSTATTITRQHPCAYVIGLRRGERLQPWQRIESAVEAGDVLIALGPPEHLIALANHAASESTA